MNRLSTEKRLQVIAALVEGSRINSIVRIAGLKLSKAWVSTTTHRHVRNLPARTIHNGGLVNLIDTGAAQNVT